MASFFKDIENPTVIEETKYDTEPPLPPPVQRPIVEEPTDATGPDTTIGDEEEGGVDERTFIDPDEEEILQSVRRQQIEARLDAEQRFQQDQIDAENRRLAEAKQAEMEIERQARERAMRSKEFFKKLPTLVSCFFSTGSR
jgi:hypothetical protein